MPWAMSLLGQSRPQLGHLERIALPLTFLSARIKTSRPAHFRVLTSTRRIIDFSSGISIQYSSFILSPTSTRSSTTDLPSKKRFMHVTQSKKIPSFRLISYNILKHTKVGFALNPCENIMSRKFPYTPISTNTTFKTWKSLD
jgi:hypothetical protein